MTIIAGGKRFLNCPETIKDINRSRKEMRQYRAAKHNPPKSVPFSLTIYMLGASFQESVVMDRRHSTTVNVESEHFLGEVVLLDNEPILCSLVKKGASVVSPTLR